MSSNPTHPLFWKSRLVVRNALRVADVVLSRRLHRTPRSLPILLMFLTNRCNLRCQMCGVRDLPGNANAPGELSTDEWRNVLGAARRLGVSIVSISGGEPLLRPDLGDIVRCASDHGISVHLCTNGALLDDARAVALADAGVRAVSISVESPDLAIHDALRGPGSFDGAVEAIARLRRLAPGISVSINSVLTTRNIAHLARMVPFAESLGVQQVKFAPIHANLLHRGKDRAEFDDLFFTPDRVPELAREIDALVAACRRSRLLTTSRAFLEGIPAYYAAPRRFRCYAGYADCAVDPYGRVAPCCDMDSPLSVRDLPLDQIWRSAEFQELRERVRHCSSVCWDTTNTEFSLRLRPAGLLREVVQTWRDLGFYFDA